MNERTVLRTFFAASILIGLLTRVAPMLDQDRLFQQWPTEDGYLMLTIARNIALGNGMSIADGEIATNGTQPLATLIYAGFFVMTGSDKTASIYLIHIFEIAVSCATCFAIFGFAKALLKGSNLAGRVPYVAAGLWFISPVIVKHSMNHLETGVYFLFMLLSVWAWHHRLGDPSKSNDMKSAVVVGVLLGFSSLSRIDAVFLIAAVTVWNLAPYAFKHREHFKNRLVQSLIMGSFSVVITSPWLIYNKVNFGSWRPISGVMLSDTDRPHREMTVLEENYRKVPMTTLEYFGIAVPFPGVVERNLVFQSACRFGFLIGILTLLYLAAKGNWSQRLSLAIPLSVLACFILYYGFLFGSPRFIPRYFSPLSTFFAISSSISAIWLFDRLRCPKLLSLTVLLALVGVSVAGQIREYNKQPKHYHWQVKTWTEENVADDVWVGAIQTGMLGYFHDKTINLDGKVNPHAVAAKADNRLMDYIQKSKIQYLVDWNGTILYLHGFIKDHFHVIVDEPNQGLNGLGVLERKSK